MTRRLLIGTLLGGLLLAAAVGYLLWATRPSVDQLLLQSRSALESGQTQEAERLAREVLASQPDNYRARYLAGQAAAHEGDAKRAAGYLRTLPGDESATLEQQIGAGRLLFEMAYLRDAERCFRAALKQASAHPDVHRWLAIVLDTQGRRYESQPHAFLLLRSGQYSLDELLSLGEYEEPFDNTARLDQARRRTPSDPLPLLGKSRTALLQNRPEQALRWLRRLVASDPDLAEAQAQLGNALLELDRDAAVAAWSSNLPDSVDEHPEIWFVRGYWAQRQDQSQAAARCFWEAVRRSPEHRRAGLHLAQTLRRLGRGEQAAPFERRAEQLAILKKSLDTILVEGPTASRMQQVAEQLERLGRLWEAWAWWSRLADSNPSRADAEAATKRLATRLRQEMPPRTLSSANPAQAVDLAAWPLPDWSQPVRLAVDDFAQPPPSEIRFEELTEIAGIDFAYFNGSDRFDQGLPIYRTTGGGVAILDYDQDGWPDIYLTQGALWPPSETRENYCDVLYRNLGDGRFADVTAAAGLGDLAYSQGATVGDFNNDGYPDLYVANLGPNRLYANRGDGTFRDASRRLGGRSSGGSESGERSWTTSCLLADLTGDGLPDLYDVNYLSGDDLFTRLCGRPPRSCPPAFFEAALDRLMINQGNGNWRDATESSSLASFAGKGLGIVAADWEGSGVLSLMIANDGVPNVLLSNRRPRTGTPMWEDRGMQAGVALNRDGRAEACMGIAVDDADGDGRLDIFVTNFYGESNTLYRQQKEQLFEDATATTGLRDPGFLKLGFGTQFLDADLDGDPDLIVSNGHIDDFSHQGRPFRMSPQLYENLGRGRFREVDAKRLGPFFRQPSLGRGLARLDWNRDGREEFVVSHLDAAATLLTNRSPSAGHWLALRLVGTDGSRDAIGAMVRVRYGAFSRSRQLVAGDGFQASNERQLVFGLGVNQQVEDVEVRWPSGRVQRFDDLAVDRRYTIVESRQPVQAFLAGHRSIPLGAD